jgi:hypothetical protein
MSLPKTTPAWIIHASNSDAKGFENLKFEKEYPLPDVGEDECLVQIQAVSLNYRDLVIPKVNVIIISTVLCSRMSRACTLYH